MLIYRVSFFLLAISKTLATKNTTQLQRIVEAFHPLHESILCRVCGNDISHTQLIVTNKLSPVSEYTFNDTIFGKILVVVQELPTEFLFDIPVVTFKNSTCSGIQEWEESTWFPGYLSRPCVCPECGTYLGWIFEPKKRSDDIFFGFILAGIIGETCK